MERSMSDGYPFIFQMIDRSDSLKINLITIEEMICRFISL